MFSGNISEWPVFREMFGVAIDANATTDFERQMHLAQHLSPQIKEMMGTLLTDPTQYLAGLEYLEANYGGADRLKLGCIAKIRALPILRDNDYAKLKEFVAGLTSAVMTLCNAGYRSQLDHVGLLQDLLNKLPPRLKSDWGRYIICQPPGVPADPVTFMSWIQLVLRQEAAAQTVIDPTTSLTNTKAADPKPKTPAKKGVFTTTNLDAEVEPEEPPISAVRPQRTRRASTGSMPGPVEKPFTPCIMCKNSHCTEDCPEFQKLTPNERLWRVLYHRHCLNCLRRHATKVCQRDLPRKGLQVPASSPPPRH